MATLQFGINPFDRCPSETGRYHVVDSQGLTITLATQILRKVTG